ncbi:MAG TPA: TMEM165/GDT1 family protein, partial [Peptostreptococcaceae bacterium]|nr:TMEM165/GDT1 family protein [Peptostreptococcaceae bacterium]
LFIFFGLWSLKFEAAEDEENESKGNYGPVATVALAFFIGELGDKTQLTAMTLGATSHYPLLTLLGTVTGMIVVGGIGIVVGKLLGKKIPEATMKVLASAIFIFFGSLGLYNSLRESGYGYAINPVNIAAYLGIITLLILLVIRYNAISRDKHYQEKLGQILAKCKGCGNCSEGSCSINKAREELEVQYFGENIPYVGDIIKYIEAINKKDMDSGLKIAETYRKNKG